MKFDVAVIGAGPAGISAALSSARNGSRTVLCTDRPVLGGNSSSEIRVWTRGATGGGNLFSEEMGTFGRLKLRNLAENPDGNVLYWDEILLDSALNEKNLTLYLNLPITEIKTDNSHVITSVSGTQLSSGKRIEIEADRYIDATGDGEIAFLAGCPFMSGTESRYVFGESMAGESDTKDKLCSSLLWQTKLLDHPVPYTPPSYAYSLSEVENMIEKGGRIVTAGMQGSDCWWFEYGGLMDTIGDSQEISFELRRIVFGIWNYIKNSGKFDADNLTLEWVGSIPGKRESRRFRGEHILTQDEITENRCLPDAVAYGGWFLDAHPADGIFSSDENCIQVPVNCYGIPLGCFYNREYPNLFFTGRAAGTSHVAFTSYRIMNTCALAGDACGIAASECCKRRITAEELETLHKDEFLDKLAREDIIFNRPLHDLLEDCTVEADSQHKHVSILSGGSLALKDDIYMCVPVSGEEIEFAINSSAAQTIRCSVSTFDQPSRLTSGQDQRENSFEVEKGLNLIRFQLQKGKAFSVIHFDAVDNASLCLGESLIGVSAGIAGEPEVFHPYVRWHGSYSADNVLHGYARPYKGANAWMSEHRQGSLTIHLPEEKHISVVRLYLDPDFSTELTSSHCAVWGPNHHFYARTGMPGHLLKDFTLSIDGKTTARITDNKERMSVIPVNADVRKSIELRIDDTYGENAVVYRILAE